MNYADSVVGWLAELGYTHCFFVAGGNIMHLLNSARKQMTCVAFVHEVAAGIAAEYFNEAAAPGRAFVMVTAGPGLTNLVTAFAGAFLESRELLVLGGQVKSTDLATNGLRQRGIQEVDGVSIVRPVTVCAERLEAPMDRGEFVKRVMSGRVGRPGPVFLEMCLDVQGRPVSGEGATSQVEPASATGAPDMSGAAVERLCDELRRAERPVLLIGGGVSRETAARVLPDLRRLGVPVMTTWNGADRIPASERMYFGRPNTWGMRYSNVLIQQADLIVALGTRLGLQQTGFNWKEFGRRATVAQVDLDERELAKGHPRVDIPIAGDANPILRALLRQPLRDFSDWLDHATEVKALLPVDEAVNQHRSGYLSPFGFMLSLSDLCRSTDCFCPSSSGGAETVAMQVFEQKEGQIVVGDKGLASMGYGLSGAIGLALGHPGRRTVLTEGDGGFSQNLQELATVAVNDLNLKIFLMCNEGYASIRMTQRNYFEGNYVGCDVNSGLGFPDWSLLFGAYGVPCLELAEGFEDDAAFGEAFDRPGPAAFIVPVDPEQTYYPKIGSRVTAEGSMESRPLHLMDPPLPDEIAARVFVFLEDRP
ncbi:MAG TPA: thiamine pyrophosphate-binding protein [Acidimicrobiales bacterium]|nr:thiamine pyrophosphate-binding protein [Acidimicrobiales bacterium]